MIQIETITAVVGVESGFDPLAIRINSDAPRPDRPGSKAEAIEIATTFAAEGHNIDLGLGGISVYDLPKLGLSISDLFDPCLNLKATGTLLDRYYRAAVAAGAVGEEAEALMLQSYYGQGDAEVGAMVEYDRRIADEKRQLAETLPSLALRSGEGAESLPSRDGLASALSDPPQPNRVTTTTDSAAPAADSAAPVQAWDVFGQSRQSTVLIFPR